VWKRAALSATVALTALALTAACNNGDSTTTSADTTATPSGTAAGNPAGTTTTPAGRTATKTAKTNHPTTRTTTPVGDPGDAGQLAGLGTEADWKKFLAPCPDSRQKILIQKVVTADVNGDGTHDALVAHACSPITAYWPTEVDVFDGASASSAPKRLGTLLKDVGASDMPYLDSMKVKDGGVVVIAAYGVGPGDDAACPSVYYTYQYTFSGGRFSRVGRDAGNADHCPDITD
jgi:hypothetical protein